MTLSWSFLTLALLATDGPQPSPPRIPKSPTSIRISVRPVKADLSEYKIVLSGDVRSASARLNDEFRGRCALVDEICTNLCPEGILDEGTIAASSRWADAPVVCQADGAGCPDKAVAPPSPMAMAKVARRADTLAANTMLAITSPPSPMAMAKGARPGITKDPEPKETWPLTLRDAICIGLDNCEIVRVIAFGNSGVPVGGTMPTTLKIGAAANGDKAKVEPIVIARLNADAAVWRIKAELMAHVRSVEQQYWNLAQAHVQLWAADRAVSLAQEVLNREQAELQVGRGTIADVAEAAQRLEQFKLDLVTRTSDVITTERQLRNLLGLPPADNRRIIPITPCTEARIEPDWDSSLAEMLDSQPDVVQQRFLVHIAEAQLLTARSGLAPAVNLNAIHQLNGLGQQPESGTAMVTWEIGGTFQMPLGMRCPLANTRQAQYALLRSRAYYQQVVHQTTHSLARFFLEIDANYKQFQTAKRLRAAAAQRLDAQRAYYEEGRITIDRFLDAISQYATAVATEAQFKTTYNISLVALEEAKGTLLAYDNIVIAERPHRATLTAVAPADADQTGSKDSKPDTQVVTASLAVGKPTASDGPAAKPQGPSNTPATATAEKSKTWSFSITIGGAKPLQITGTIRANDGETAPAAH